MSNRQPVFVLQLALITVCAGANPASLADEHSDDANSVEELLVFVTDSQNSPLAGARVMLEIGAYEDDDFTNSIGRAEFADVPLGSVDVEVRHTGQGLDIYRGKKTVTIESKEFRIKLKPLGGVDDLDPDPESQTTDEPDEEDELDDSGAGGH